MDVLYFMELRVIVIDSLIGWLIDLWTPPPVVEQLKDNEDF